MIHSPFQILQRKRQDLKRERGTDGVGGAGFNCLRSKLLEIFIDFKIEINNKKAYISGCSSIG
jgi:hypothetical protein